MYLNYMKKVTQKIRMQFMRYKYKNMTIWAGILKYEYWQSKWEMQQKTLFYWQYRRKYNISIREKMVYKKLRVYPTTDGAQQHEGGPYIFTIIHKNR